MVSDLKLDPEQSTAQHSNLSSAAAIAGRARTKYDGSHPLTNLSRFQGDRLFLTKYTVSPFPFPSVGRDAPVFSIKRKTRPKQSD
ncbi:hypothetical protein HZ326_2870 [Fusarium oxysporum f. sp. albedinis]|nr:hypothetical protein HZ326_2870 [Fusarium oxysporum f. sp. albedinis]